jgi:hypothetical protein
MDKSPRLITNNKWHMMHWALVNIEGDLPDHNICRWTTITEICSLSSSQSDWNCHVFTCLTWYVHNLRHTYLYRWTVSKECPQTWTMSIINKLSQMKHSNRRINETHSIWNRIPCRLQAQTGERVNISSDAFGCTILSNKHCHIYLSSLSHNCPTDKAHIRFK